METRAARYTTSLVDHVAFKVLALSLTTYEKEDFWSVEADGSLGPIVIKQDRGRVYHVIHYNMLEHNWNKPYVPNPTKKRSAIEPEINYYVLQSYQTLRANEPMSRTTPIEVCMQQCTLIKLQPPVDGQYAKFADLPRLKLVFARDEETVDIELLPIEVPPPFTTEK